jgi:hypothetical protein
MGDILDDDDDDDDDDEDVGLIQSTSRDNSGNTGYLEHLMDRVLRCAASGGLH